MTVISMHDVAAGLTEGLDISKKTARELSRRTLVTMIDLLDKEGVTLNFPGLGRIKVKEIPARDYRNPKTGDKVSKKASRKVVFSRTRGENEVV